MANINGKSLLPVILGLLSFIMFVASAATCSWIKSESELPPFGKVTSTIGLWKSCTESERGSTSSIWDSSKPCSDYENGTLKDTCQKGEAQKAFVVMACIFSGAVTIWCIMLMFRKMGTKLITVALFIVSAICGVIAMAIAADVHDKYWEGAGFKLDAGFGLVIVGWILSLVGALVAQFAPAA